MYIMAKRVVHVHISWPGVSSPCSLDKLSPPERLRAHINLCDWSGATINFCLERKCLESIIICLTCPLVDLNKRVLCVVCVCVSQPTGPIMACVCTHFDDLDTRHLDYLLSGTVSLVVVVDDDGDGAGDDDDDDDHFYALNPFLSLVQLFLSWNGNIFLPFIIIAGVMLISPPPTRMCVGRSCLL